MNHFLEQVQVGEQSRQIIFEFELSQQQAMQQAATQLSNIFQDMNFAWELLNAEIEIEMRNLVSGETIAYLLQLYMRGVQRMNSLADPRESYFKNKVTSLMSKQTVIKSLKENPMKKKTKPDEIVLKQQQPKQQKHQNHAQKTPKKKKTIKQTILPNSQPTKQVNQLELKQKRRQLEMRMAYVVEQHGPDSLKKIIAKEDHRQQNISKKISKIISSHEERLNERIKARKLRTATFRTRSQVNMQQTQTMQSTQFYQKQMQRAVEQFSPFAEVSINHNKILQNQQQNQQKNSEQRRKCKSLEIFINFQSPEKKPRKYTFDLTSAEQPNNR